jgi:hypothetical protein
MTYYLFPDLKFLHGKFLDGSLDRVLMLLDWRVSIWFDHKNRTKSLGNKSFLRSQMALLSQSSSEERQ